MARKAPGQHQRQGLSLVEVVGMFPDNDTAERWFTNVRWPEGVCCPRCGSVRVRERPSRVPQPFHCGACRKYFSAKTGTLMEGSNLGFRTWVLALYLLSTGIKGTSSMKLHRDLGITQKSAWHLAHRIRETWDTPDRFGGPVEVDETFVGGRERNKHASKKLRAGRGTVGKSVVAGAKDRTTNRVNAAVVGDTTAGTLQGFVRSRVVGGAKVFTDGHAAYDDLAGYDHEAVRHSVGEYVRGQAHTNGIDSFWSMLKRGYQGTYHQMSDKHLGRYVTEFAGRHNQRQRNTIDQMRNMARGLCGKRLRYADLVA